MRLSTWRSSPPAALGLRDVVAGIWLHLGTVNPLSHFQTAGQAAYSVSKAARWPCQTNERNKKEVQMIRYKKSCRYSKRTLSRSATGWMLHFNVRNTNYLLNNMYQRICCWEGIWCYAHWMKHPACCTAAQKSFLNLQDFLYFMILLHVAKRLLSPRFPPFSHK